MAREPRKPAHLTIPAGSGSHGASIGPETPEDPFDRPSVVERLIASLPLKGTAPLKAAQAITPPASTEPLADSSPIPPPRKHPHVTIYRPQDIADREHSAADAKKRYADEKTLETRRWLRDIAVWAFCHLPHVFMGGVLLLGLVVALTGLIRPLLH